MASNHTPFRYTPARLAQIEKVRRQPSVPKLEVKAPISWWCHWPTVEGFTALADRQLERMQLSPFGITRYTNDIIER